ncbi:MAG: hypothetical protein GWN99_12450 [Gemmatimonadetes bacterium]|uniref:Uncharacterized protein n=1 Tax=Candidatus Kutchimonas denitrificans TaxID=3056748 RepID=A0AAE5C9J3_9BACT|nr:hypothetical protein [Gemmatimonadota bacterium]NIR75541.1 hypothetical protein [Candidatus Kutchimonas denitrificans]NIS01855.1 hypothetical protein [Gemmatimonadota bacterium]NIT67636.1 hypothetical protein [Gemmatimonadota bacterium]NIU53510.1 hypothetical protein [Gemmatimonadota bacterium]
MNVAIIIVALVAVVAIAVLVLFGRRRAAGKAKEPEGEGAAKPQAEPPEVGPVAAVPPEAKAEDAEAARSVAEVEQEREHVEEAPAKPQPVETEEEVAERVNESLAEARRMLKELQEGEGGAEAGTGALHGTMDIMTEGLEEVEALADRKKWSQARDKAEALRAQLKLMLQSARRERSSD